MLTIVDWGREQRAMGGRINPLQDDERHANIFYTKHYTAK